MTSSWQFLLLMMLVMLASLSSGSNCTKCENPCINCAITPIFTKNECITFSCGEKTRTLIGTTPYDEARMTCVNSDSGMTKWTLSMNGASDQEVVTSNNVQCKKLCTLVSPLANSCDINDIICEKANLHDYDDVTCPNQKKMYWKPLTNVKIKTFPMTPLMSVEVLQMLCPRKNDGYWQAKLHIKEKNYGVRVDAVSTVYCHHGCNISAYYEGGCGDENQCEMPKIRDAGSKFEEVICPPDFGLQVNFGANQNPSGWNDVSSILCKFHRLKVFMKVVETGLFPHGIRCIHKKLDRYYTDSKTDDEESMQPTNCGGLKCDKGFYLQVKSSAESQWEGIASLRCDSDKFYFRGKLYAITEKIVDQVRCARYKCAACTSPCKNCVPGNFIPSTKWNECSKFACPKATRTIVDSNPHIEDNVDLTCNSVRSDGSYWRINNVGSPRNIQNIECRNSCKLRHNLVSICSEGDRMCQTWFPEDDEPAKSCKKANMYITPFMQNRMYKIVGIWCNKDDGSWTVQQEGTTSYQRIRSNDMAIVDCHHGCDLDQYFNDVCGGENDCVKPIRSHGNDQDHSLKCPDEYGMQVASNKNEFHDVSSLSCINYKLKVYENGKSIADEFPYGVRCIRKRIDTFFHPHSSETEVYQRPSNCSSLKCDEGWALQFKFENRWEEVENATCNSDKFTTLPDRNAQPSEIRCIRLKCTFCKNPCPNCHANSTASFNKSETWDDCAKFSCGAQTETVYTRTSDSSVKKLNDVNLICKEMANGRNIWKPIAKEETIESEVTCKNSCEQINELRSECQGNDTSCEELPKGVFECWKKMFYESDNGTQIELNKMECDASTGEWKATLQKGRGKISLPKYSNVFCHMGNCQTGRIFPECDYNDNECDEYLPGTSSNEYICDEKMPSTTFWYRLHSINPWVKMEGVRTLYCVAGKIVVNNTKQPYEFQAQCRIEKVASQKAGSDVPLAFAITSVVLILIVIVIATILLRVTGLGWPHQLILERIRAKKKPRRDYSSKKSPSAFSPHPSPKSKKRSIKRETASPAFSPSSKSKTRSANQTPVAESVIEREKIEDDNVGGNDENILIAI